MKVSSRRKGLSLNLRKRKKEEAEARKVERSIPLEVEDEAPLKVEDKTPLEVEDEVPLKVEDKTPLEPVYDPGTDFIPTFSVIASVLGIIVMLYIGVLLLDSVESSLDQNLGVNATIGLQLEEHLFPTGLYSIYPLIIIGGAMIAAFLGFTQIGGGNL